MKRKEMEDEFMLSADVSRKTGAAAATVIWWERTGKLKALRTASGVRLFRRTDVEKLAAERAAKQKGQK